MVGKLIRHFLFDGNADGIQTLENSNMTIKGTVFPRPMFAALRQVQQRQVNDYRKYGRKSVGAWAGKRQDRVECLYEVM